MSRLGRGVGHAGRLAQRSVAEFFDDDCPQRAAAISYYGLFSVFPLAILLVGVFGLLVRDEQARTSVIDFLLDHLPLREDAGRQDLGQLLDDVTAGAGGFGVIGILGLLFAASGLMGAIRQALNAAWDVDAPRPPVQGKLIDIGLVLAAAPIVALSFGLTLATRLVVSSSGDLRQLGTVGDALARGVLALGQLTPIVIAFLIFLAAFRLLPAGGTRLRDVWLGAAVAAVGFELAKTLFAVYLAHMADYNAVYASLGSVIAFVVFVFIAANVFLLGAEAGAHWPEVRDGRLDDDDGDDGPLRERLLAGVRRLFVRER